MFEGLFNNEDNKKKQQTFQNVNTSQGKYFNDLFSKNGSTFSQRQPQQSIQQQEKQAQQKQQPTKPLQKQQASPMQNLQQTLKSIQDQVSQLFKNNNPFQDKKVVSPIPQKEQLNKNMVAVPAVQNEPIGQGASLSQTWKQAMNDLSTGITPSAYAPKDRKNLNQLYQQNIQKIKSQPVARLQHDTTNFILGMMQGWTNATPNPVKNMTPEDMFIKPIAQAAGGAVSISKIGGVVDKILGAGSLGKFLDSTKYLKFMKGILSNVSAMDIYGQLDPTIKDRLKQLQSDSEQGTLNGLLEPISSLKASVPVSFAGGVGLAMMNGADLKSGLINGVIMAALDASGKLGAKSPLPDEKVAPKSTFVASNAKGLTDEELQQKRLQAVQDLAKNPEDKTKQDTLQQIYEEMNKRGLSKNATETSQNKEAISTETEKPKTVPISQIETGLSKYIEQNANTATPKIKDYEQVLRNGGSLEPIPVYVENGKYVLNKDGFHRLQAYKNIGRTDVSIKVEPKTELSASAKQREENTKYKVIDYTKKPSFSSKQSRAVQQVFNDRLDEIRQNTDSAGELTTQTQEAIDKAIQFSKGDKTVLAGLRTSLNKEMFGFVGMSGNYKADYAALQTMMTDPEIGPYLEMLDKNIRSIDEKLNLPTKEEQKPLEPIGKGETKTSGLARGVSEKAVEKKLTEGFEGLPEYKQVNMKDQAKKAMDILKGDPEGAKAIAMGTKLPPHDVLPESVFTAVENDAIEKGDVDTLRELATSSTLTTQATAMGQRIRALAERNPDDPVKYITQVSKAKQDNFKKQLRGKESAKDVVNKTVDEIKQQVDKKLPTKNDWQKFVESIQC